MPTYLSPGVYVEEIDGGSKPIAGVGTAVAAFVGFTKKGPMIFEINPRFSSTVYMRHKLGFTDVIWSLKEFYDEPVKLTCAKIGSVCIRKQDVMTL